MGSSKLLLFDTASLYFRAFFALPDSLRAQDGRSVNAVRGLLEFLARFVAEAEPTHLACCWDVAWRPQWRVALVPTYKSHRVLAETPSGAVEQTPAGLDHQVGWIREVLAALGIPVIGAPDAEADDVIATLTATAGMPTEIVTGDRDLFQLVSDAQGVAVRYVGAGMKRSEVVTDGRLLARYGITGDGYADFALLRGDASDGLPGVAGIGEKTAAALVAAHGDLDHILAAATAGLVSPGVTAKLAAATDYLGAAREVVRVRRDLPGLPAPTDLLRPQAPASEEEFALLTETLKLGSAADRIRGALWPAFRVS
ncbi:5'-3' exonuclease [Propionicicella superfundia]|uniref:5'-3' exonuclease n=1 Tax=Propionicicella superfundia TaxID=348582 RepID=UPI000491E121|nr:5'-3' exonuclease [Propionicicella superfundia]